jgi:Cys-tRNA(Pro) deacylase
MGDQYFEQQSEELRQFLDFIGEDLENVKRVIDFCDKEDLDVDFKIHSKSETAKESAQKLDVELDQIVKTLVFKAGDDFVAALCPGDSRVSEQKLEEITGEEVRMAKPSEVKKATGYVVGGVSPFDLDIPVYMEESLTHHKEVKPAAGSRVVGVTLEPEELKSATGSQPHELTLNDL